MARVGIVFGLLLCGSTYAAMVWDPDKIPEQFIPMMFGIPLLFCGVVALNPHRRKISMQVAASVTGLVGVSGVLWCVTRGLRLATGKLVNVHGLTIIAVMSLLCLVFVVVWGRLFFQMRRRQAARAVSCDAAGNNDEVQNLSSTEEK